VLSGRRAQAARNDQVILNAARKVFSADPEAPIAAVAEHAGVGISALYRRYRSKEELLRRLAREGLERYISEVSSALADPGDPWAAFCRVMQRTVAASDAPLTLRCDGLEEQAVELTSRLLERVRGEYEIRPEIEVSDIALLLDLLQPVGTEILRQRYLMLLLDSLHFLSMHPLPGPAPKWQELWHARRR
jgi:AcrR family transcriptional regulator